MSIHTLDTFKELLLEGLCDSDVLPKALQLVNAHCGADTAQLISVSDATFILDSAVEGTLDRHLFENEQDYLAVNPRTRILASREIGRIVRDHEVADEDTVATNAAYQELLIPAGVGQFAGTVLASNDSTVVALAIARPRADGPFSDDAISRFADLVRVAIPVTDLAGRIVSRQESSLLDMFGSQASVAILHKSGTIIRQSDQFEKLLAAGVIRTDGLGRLDLLSDESNRNLALTLRGKSNAIGGRFSFARLRPECTYICSVSPVPPVGHFGARSGHAVLFIDKLTSVKSLDRNLLRQTYSLTAAECDVCERLYAGQTVAEIATARAVATSTVKTLLKSIMLKMAVNRQAEIVIKSSRFAFDSGMSVPVQTSASDKLYG
ncbi:LuxR C-terminal-related transcriptional regulator [Hyphomonas sp.]|uniref:helix-turn-helix transcriptional regulator n=1 Tax=Hyphomonas sp. TaxID=87 RepID=UPI0025BF06CE|nr:LuxR C-terminal-related transcriptional regulator [Hyphomonas sp.]